LFALTLFLGVFGAEGALAHHSFAMFDNTKPMTLRGVVREFQWTNPHSWIQLTVPRDGGGADEWSIELKSPGGLLRRGWKFNSLKPGDNITLTIAPLKDGSHGGSLNKIILQSGEELSD
jgi:hypothetical protein